MAQLVPLSDLPPGLGFTRAIGSIRGVESLQAIEALGRDLIPRIESF